MPFSHKCFQCHREVLEPDKVPTTHTRQVVTWHKYWTVTDAATADRATRAHLRDTLKCAWNIRFKNSSYLVFGGTGSDFVLYFVLALHHTALQSLLEVVKASHINVPVVMYQQRTV